MAKRWKPALMMVQQDITGAWFASNEEGKWQRFPKWEQAMTWVWGNWSYCDHCGNYTPEHPEYNVCRGCGHRHDSFGEGNVYGETRARLAHDLMRLTPDMNLENYLLDAEEVIALLPHLLPLDVREAMFDETEEE